VIFRDILPLLERREGDKMSIFDFMRIMGIVLRVLGAAVFGVGVGWLVIHVLKWQLWQLATAAILGLLGAFVLVAHWTGGGGTLGAFGLGAGAGLLVWGLMQDRRAEASPPATRTRRQ
jgi:hypothetical protein